MLNCPVSNRPADPTVHQDWNTAKLIGLDNVQQADEGDREHDQAREGDALPKTKGSRVCLSRKRTHNDQLAVALCGVVLARETFYNAESEFLLHTFPNQMPQVCFYDNACRLVEHIYHSGAHHKAFADTVIPVNPFHFRSHKDSAKFYGSSTHQQLRRPMSGTEGLPQWLET
ncbi:uncharacterized protein MELLADRAFT_90456 [Melampsora larici-populina 98AG31]|uniref:Uncharacterized protein n=1 Tax=Melampsora larici-populina (strain 98AG31 / pathotype 3-4-7) TaxID=747676 RepID=F4RX08_MELLP|nr:uncharacterized protein MELLADRAFT_90456 [Melampsora larici-populina 98AG31]EGG03126.1 hypothetical protein MELLADRAFT_90456 [Melampsora larici-populina 98AG31]